MENVAIKEILSIPNLRKIFVVHGERWDNNLHFMYKPFVDTIRTLFSSHPSLSIEYYHRAIDYERIEPEDVLIFIGIVDRPCFDFFNNKGIYTIYYNTEPDVDWHPCKEIWTYSKYAFEIYSKQNGQLIKFVPILAQENVPLVPYHLSEPNTMLFIFLGYLDFRPEKRNYLFQSDCLRENIREIYSLWNDTVFHEFISGKPYLYLNITKTGMDRPGILPSVRINTLLSHKAIIISEHCSEIDESLYTGMVSFCSLEEIEGEFMKWRGKTGEELQMEADTRYELFQRAFVYEQGGTELILRK
jgi:hypothetical protein